MKLIATSDWHVGNVFHGIDRSAEHRHFFHWLTETAVRTEADALLVAGDVFDNSNPSAASQELYYGFLSDITARCPQLQIIITAGNHDSAMRLEAPRSLLARHHVEVRGALHRHWTADDDGGQWTADVDDLLLTVSSRDGSQQAVVAAVPYLRSEVMVDGSYSAGVKALLERLTARARQRYPDMPLVMMTHMYATGAVVADNGSERTVGGLEQVDMGDWTAHPDYLTSGHIHRRQHIFGAPWARYTGSALPMSFAECDYHHGADLLTIGTDRSVSVEFLEYTPTHHLLSLEPMELRPLLKTLRTTLPELEGDAPDDQSLYVELSVVADMLRPEDRLKISETFEGRNALCLKVNQVLPDIDLTQQPAREQMATIGDVINRPPIDSIEEAFRIRHRRDINDRQRQLLEAIVRSV